MGENRTITILFSVGVIGTLLLTAIFIRTNNELVSVQISGLNNELKTLRSESLEQYKDFRDKNGELSVVIERMSVKLNETNQELQHTYSQFNKAKEEVSVLNQQVKELERNSNQAKEKIQLFTSLLEQNTVQLKNISAEIKSLKTSLGKEETISKEKIFFKETVSRASIKFGYAWAISVQIYFKAVFKLPLGGLAVDAGQIIKEYETEFERMANYKVENPELEGVRSALENHNQKALFMIQEALGLAREPTDERATEMVRMYYQANNWLREAQILLGMDPLGYAAIA